MAAFLAGNATYSSKKVVQNLPLEGLDCLFGVLSFAEDFFQLPFSLQILSLA